jgi:hypothetical protein
MENESNTILLEIYLKIILKIIGIIVLGNNNKMIMGLYIF